MGAVHSFGREAETSSVLHISIVRAKIVLQLNSAALYNYQTLPNQDRMNNYVRTQRNFSDAAQQADYRQERKCPWVLGYSSNWSLPI